jgi:hypothetical protein
MQGKMAGDKIEMIKIYYNIFNTFHAFKKE